MGDRGVLRQLGQDAIDQTRSLNQLPKVPNSVAVHSAGACGAK
jgi:hypothetical protein